MIASRNHAVIWLLAACFCWLVPLLASKRAVVFAWVPVPRWLQFETDCAALFTKREADWNQVVYRVWRAGGAGWEEAGRDLMSPMPVAGYRQRLDRLVATVQSKPKLRDQVWPRLASHLAARIEGDKGKGSPVSRIHLARTRWMCGTPEMVQAAGHWHVPPLSDLPPGVKVIHVMTCTVKNGKMVLVKPARKPALAAGSKLPPPQPPNGTATLRPGAGPATKTATPQRRTLPPRVLVPPGLPQSGSAIQVPLRGTTPAPRDAATKPATPAPPK